MKPHLTTYWVFLFFLFARTGPACAQPSPDIRQVRWGFSPKQVKEAEATKPTSAKRDKLMYARIPLTDRTVGLEYEFNGDSLLSAAYYYYTTAAVTKADVLAAATDFEALLTEKYGPGKASRVGGLRNVIWRTPRTQISLAVGNVDQGWSVEVTYLCRVCSSDQPKTGASDQQTFKPRKDIKDF